MDPKKWEEIRRKAREKTEKEFASETSSYIHLTEDEIKEITPTPIDREKLAELMSIVKDATKSNRDKAESIRTIDGLAEIAASMLGKIA